MKGNEKCTAELRRFTAAAWRNWNRVFLFKTPERGCCSFGLLGKSEDTQLVHLHFECSFATHFLSLWASQFTSLWHKVCLHRCMQVSANRACLYTHMAGSEATTVFTLSNTGLSGTECSGPHYTELDLFLVSCDASMGLRQYCSLFFLIFSPVHTIFNNMRPYHRPSQHYFRSVCVRICVAYSGMWQESLCLCLEEQNRFC